MGTDDCHCQICGADVLVEIEDFAALSRVTSDCLPFRPGGRLGVCDGCGAIQKVPDQRWLADTAEIYQKYDIYHQSGGVEQSVFDAMTGQPKQRSRVLAEHVASALHLQRAGRLLDFGCGSGPMLGAFSEVRPQWSLCGFDLDHRKLARLEQIPGFSALYTGALAEVPSHFDLVTMSHSLEHLPAPHTVLCSLREKLTRDGWLFIQVPNAGQNPFDLVVADHLCHFTADTLAHLVARAGFTIEQVETNWINKEISLLARPADALSVSPQPVRQPLVVERVRAYVSWLHAVVGDARCTAATKPFGLFGTSISATWLFAHLVDDVQFFIDEDPARVSSHHMQQPIWPPDKAPVNAVVYLVLIPAIAHAVRERLQSLPLHLHMPPPLP